ncbi:MAG: patatin-like phospholipase family protein, partial [Planctomycetota bacterium]
KKATRKTAKPAAKQAKKSPTRQAAKGATKEVRKARKKTRGKRTAERKGPRWAVALSGHGSRGAFVIGALERFRALEGRFDCPVLVGSGTGALVAALAATNLWQEMRSTAHSLASGKLLRLRYPWAPHAGANLFLASLMNTQSLYMTDGLKRILAARVDPEALKASDTEVHFVARNMQTGEVRTFNNRDDSERDLMDGLEAALSRPVTMPLVRAGEERYQYSGAGVSADATLRALFCALRRDGTPKVDRVLAISAGTDAGAEFGYRDLVSILHRTLDLASGDGSIRNAQLVNGLLGLRQHLPTRAFEAAVSALDPDTQAAVRSHLEKRPVPVRHIHPGAELDGVSAHEFRLDGIARALEAGSRAASDAHAKG